MSLWLESLRNHYAVKSKEFKCAERGCECQAAFKGAIKGTKELMEATCCAPKSYPGNYRCIDAFFSPSLPLSLSSSLPLYLSTSLCALIPPTFSNRHACRV